MSTALQKTPASTSTKQEPSSRPGTSEKAYGRDAREQVPRSRTRKSPQLRTQKTRAVMATSSVPSTRRDPSLSSFFKSIKLVKCFTMFGFAVAAVHVALFGLDLAIAWPFQRASILFDVNSVVCGLALGCLSWGVFKEQVREFAS